MRGRVSRPMVSLIGLPLVTDRPWWIDVCYYMLWLTQQPSCCVQTNGKRQCTIDPPKRAQQWDDTRFVLEQRHGQRCILCRDPLAEDSFVQRNLWTLSGNNWKKRRKCDFTRWRDARALLNRISFSKIQQKSSRDVNTVFTLVRNLNRELRSIRVFHSHSRHCENSNKSVDAVHANNKSKIGIDKS